MKPLSGFFVNGSKHWLFSCMWSNGKLKQEHGGGKILPRVEAWEVQSCRMTAQGNLHYESNINWLWQFKFLKQEALRAIFCDVTVCIGIELLLTMVVRGLSWSLLIWSISVVCLRIVAIDNLVFLFLPPAEEQCAGTVEHRTDTDLLQKSSL